MATNEVYEGFLTEEQRQLMRSTSLSREAAMEADHSSKGAAAGIKGQSTGSGAGSGKHERRSHTGKSGRPKKGGGGGKGTWGVWLEDGKEIHMDRKDPNYDSEEEPYKLVGAPVAQSLEEFKEKVVLLVEEYFTTGNVADTASDLRDLGSPNYHHHFVKKLISMALDRHDREKEMASVLLSALYADVIDPEQLAKGFTRLLESVDDLSLDIPDAADLLALFLARAVVDDILPPAFLSKTQKVLPEGSKGLEVIQNCEKSYLMAPLHAEIVERRWGGSTHTTVEEVKKKIVELLKEYVESGDKAEACRCIRQLNVPFFHHEVVKKALTVAMEKRNAEPLILSLLRECADEGLITSNQISKGFARLSESLDDLALDIPRAKEMLQSLSSKATKDGWLTAAPFERNLSSGFLGLDDPDEVRKFKSQATTIIQEYFLSDDIAEVIRSLEDLAAPDYHDIFVKKLIMLAMDRKNREKEMASVLVSSLYAEAISIGQIAKAFTLLLESAEDTALDIPDAPNELALFLARAVVDDVLAPLYLQEIDEQLKEGSLGSEIVHTAQSILSARHAGERILRCWGGGTGSVFDDARDKIVKLLEEFEAGGVLTEACQCIRDLDMPFFHHEVVKKALIMAMEKKNERLLVLLQESSNEGLITTSQMHKGFARVLDAMDDLALDIPDAKAKFASYAERAKSEGWLTSTCFANGFLTSKTTLGD
ncbi:hypothetical protein O6H91_13G000400 [Diphasiastrum complanatum]|uniref:Uncharacterized protein n=2 Tax=Diphasiastrum complanatum TaxID=34168 RepID=A0ACC2BRH9_DIPCM|nr:hypothetical protein O6H91_13G000400 [Diphasiastrum complanatum]KAJ7532357.1 hypothetical protein O6H91_13G000400 [Diphasiastrum complanatum]